MCPVQLQVALIVLMPETEISLHLDVPFIVHFYSRTVGIAIYNIHILLAYNACAAWPITFGQLIFLLSFSLSPIFILYIYLITENKIRSPESTNAAFSAGTLSTTTYVNGVSPNPPSSEDALSPKSSPQQLGPSTQKENAESQPPPLTRAPTHQLLSMHRTLFEEEEDESGRDRLAERPGELIAAGEC